MATVLKAEINQENKTTSATDREKLTKRYISKNQGLFKVVNKIKLWPSKSGMLHSIKSIDRNGDLAVITTFCGETFTVRDSKNSRSARWLRNRWYLKACPRCGIPDWKLAKYATTVFYDGRQR
jgi:pyrrolysyl-tRNA synthetase-like protein